MVQRLQRSVNSVLSAALFTILPGSLFLLLISGFTTRNPKNITLETALNVFYITNSAVFFITAYRINPRFRLKYVSNKVIIALTLLNQKKHFLYYLIPLLEEVKKEIEGKE